MVKYGVRQNNSGKGQSGSIQQKQGGMEKLAEQNVQG